MTRNFLPREVGLVIGVLTASAISVAWGAAPDPAPGPSEIESRAKPAEQLPPQNWNWHIQNTDVLQFHPAFPAAYSGPNSLKPTAEINESVSLDLYAGVRLWPGAEAHADGLLWQGHGLSGTRGVDGFPNGESFRVGTDWPNVNLARLFLRQTISLGGADEPIEDGPLHLRGSRTTSRLTLTAGKLSAKDIFDNNTYANDARTQFLNWALMANEAWDFPADSLGYITGITADLTISDWSYRYGFFQMPRTANGTAIDPRVFQAWGMVVEIERRHMIHSHPGAVRLLAYLNRAQAGQYQEAIDAPVRPADIEASRAYRCKYGFGLNFEQEVVTNLGIFSRIGWSDGNTEAWTFADVDRTATLGLSLKGASWQRPNDTFGIAGVLNGLSKVHEQFLAVGGTGILAGDGALNYGWEQILETYYDFQIWNDLHVALDYQFIRYPAFNRDRGPVSVLGARLHWEF